MEDTVSSGKKDSVKEYTRPWRTLCQAVKKTLDEGVQ